MTARGFVEFFDRRGPRRIALALLLVLLSAGGIASVRRALMGSSEYDGFSKISRVAVVEQRDLYENVRHARAYPPFFGVVFAPFSLAGRMPGAILFSLVNLVALALAPWLCLRSALARRPRFGEWLLLWLPTAPLMGNVLLRCETDLVILLCVSAALWFLTTRARPAVAGALMGLAAAIKVLPAFLGLWLLTTRQWRALLGMAVAGIVLVVGLCSVVWGPSGNVERHRRWFEVVVTPYGDGGANGFLTRAWRSNNQSLMAAAYRYLAPAELTDAKGDDFVQVARIDEATVRIVARVLTVLLCGVLVFLWFWVGARGSPLARVAGMGSALIGMLEVSEMSGTGHHALLVVPFAAVLGFLLDPARSEGERRWVRRWTWLSVALVFSCAAPILKGLSFLLFGTLALLVAVALVLRSEAAASRGVETIPPAG